MESFADYIMRNLEDEIRTLMLSQLAIGGRIIVVYQITIPIPEAKLKP